MTSVKVTFFPEDHLPVDSHENTMAGTSKGKYGLSMTGRILILPLSCLKGL
jgi:hypothetical protein